MASSAPSVDIVMIFARPVLSALLLLAACTELPPNEDTAAPPPTVSPSVATAPQRPLVDLLYRTKARVAVTSTVANSKDDPQHLIDHRADTAWNGRTGDTDARILFRVPSRTRVRRLLLTAGYDRTSREGDLFFMNHRIRRVALSREGRLVGTFDLDPEDRAPQPIEVDLPGGDFELRFPEVVPGTKALWREIVVSELQVLGDAPDEELLPPAMPQVTVGALDRPLREGGAFAAAHSGIRYASLEDFCTAHLAIERPILARIKARETSDQIQELTAYCHRIDRRRIERQALARPFEKLAIVGLLEGEQFVERLLIETDQGVFSTPITFAVEDPGPGCGISSGYVIDSAVATGRPGIPKLVLEVTKTSAYLMATPDSFEAAGAFLIACTLDAAGAPRCQQEIVASFDGDGAWTYRRRENASIGVHPPRWDWTRDGYVDDEGNIRLSPCLDARGGAANCNHHNADLLRWF